MICHRTEMWYNIMRNQFLQGDIEMRMFLHYVKRHKKFSLLMIILIAFMVVGVPLVINWLSKLPAVTNYFVPSWSANDALSYYGSVLGFLSTVIFSGLALWQNHVIKEANERHTALLEQMEMVRNSPRFSIEAKSFNGLAGCLKISVKNVTDNIASDIVISELRIVDEKDIAKWKSDRRFQRACLDFHDEWLVDLQNNTFSSKNERLMFEVRYRDPFYKECVAEVTGIFAEGQSLPIFKIMNKK